MQCRKWRRRIPVYFDIIDLMAVPVCDANSIIHWLHKAMEARNYSAVESARDGRSVEIRALKPDNRSALASVVERSSKQSLYRRFFSVRRNFTDAQVDRF